MSVRPSGRAHKAQRVLLFALADLASEDGWVGVDVTELALLLHLSEVDIVDAIFELYLARLLDQASVSGSGVSYRLAVPTTRPSVAATGGGR